MVALRRPTRPQPIIVKPARLRPKPKPAKRHCWVCGADLRGDHSGSDLVCDCHPRDGFNPCHAPHAELDARIALLMWRNPGQTVNLYRALGCAATWENRAAVRRAVTRVNRAILRGHPGHGYELVTAARGGKRRMSV
jgi:hypothetical protein